MQRVRDIQRSGRSSMAARWKILDRTFLRPLFGGRERLAADGVQGYPLGPDGACGEDSDDSGDDSEPGHRHAPPTHEAHTVLHSCRHGLQRPATYGLLAAVLSAAAPLQESAVMPWQL